MKVITGKYIYVSFVLAAILYSASLSGSYVHSAAAASGVVTGSVVNIRSGPVTADNIVGTVYKDTSIEIISQSGEWYRVQVGEVSGWVHQSMVRTEDSAVQIIVGKDNVNLRSGPGTSYSSIGTASQGDVLTVVDEVGEWYQAKTAGGQVVYIRSDMTQTGNPAVPAIGTALAPAGPAPAPAAAVKTPSIIMDGQTMNFEVAPIVENNRVLVPLRAIFESMGATVVWNQASQTAIATRGNTTVLLPLNSTSPTVNGKVWALDVPAKVVNQRTLAPLRFVGEALGGSAAWDSSNYRVVLTSPADKQAEVVAVVITSDSVNLRSEPVVNNYNRVGSASYGERLAVLEESNGWYQVSRGGDRVWVAGWLVDVVREGDPAAASAASPIVEPDPETDPVPAATLAGVSISSQRTNEGLKIIMESGKKLSTDITKTGGQVSYEFADRQIEGVSSLQEYLGYASVNVSGSNSGSSAVVKIQYPVGVQYRTTTENDGKREVFTIPNYITGVSRKTFGSNGENITMSAAAPLQYTSSPTADKLEIVLSNILIGEAQASYNFSSPLISSVTFKTISSGAKNNIVLTITTSKAAKFVVGTSDDCILNILFVDQSVISARTPLVVLDAGHGGRDPGASGAILSEKDINLDLVKKAGKLLTAKGIKVVYTRQDDTYVGLDERTAMANLYNAALFVSVHQNANVSSAPSGTETYCYYPLSDPNLYMQKEERYNLALRLQEALVDKLGRIDRGVKQGNLAVLRESEMPSALVEMVFISNPEEEALLQQGKFIDLGAQAIAEGIAGYMKTYINT